MNIRHDTTNGTIEAASKTSLAEALVALGHVEVRAAWPKENLVNVAKAKRDELKAAHDEAEAKKEAERKAIIAAEVADADTQRVLQDALFLLTKAAARASEEIAEFKAKIAKTADFSLEYELRWCAEAALFASHKTKVINEWVVFFTAQVTERALTMAEIIKKVGDCLEYRIDRLAEDTGFEPNSTSAMTNLSGIAEFKAKQFEVRMLKMLVKGIEHDLNGKEMASRSLQWVTVR